MKKISLGIIGTGIAFQELHAPVLLERQDRFEIVALSSRTESRARQVAAWIAERTGREPEVYADTGDLLDRGDIDAVDVAVPINLTARIASQALQQGKHV